MTIRLAGLPAAIVTLVVVPVLAAAEPTRNIDLTLFDPTPQTSGSTFQVINADVGHSGEYVATAFASYASRPLVIGTDTSEMIVVRHHTMLTVGGAYAFARRIEIGARLPLYMQSGDPLAPGMLGVQPAQGAALGDATLHSKLRLAGAGRLRLGAGLALTLPTATDSEFAGTNKPTGRAVALATLGVTHALALHVNAGGVIRQQVQFANIQQGSGATWGAALSLRAFERVFFDIEAFGDVVPSGLLSRPTSDNVTGTASTLTTVEALAGARFQVSRQFSVGIAGGRGVTGAIGTPDLRGVLTLALAPSARPLPPLRRPDLVPDVDKSTLDTDFDKLSDAVDKCPEQPEDKDGFEDDDGCPDPDNDGDGILDEKDKCPMEAEDKDGFEDDDGCPDLDNDRDGIPDVDDKCPDKPEKINGIDDDDGCPDVGDSLVISVPDRLELLDSVGFTGVDLAPGSENVMNQLARTLQARADILRLRITVHVQPTKTPRKDKMLSERRALAVKAWLVKLGVAPERIEVRGFGGTNPLVHPKKKGAAAFNDRLELIILERKL